MTISTTDHRDALMPPEGVPNRPTRRSRRRSFARVLKGVLLGLWITAIVVFVMLPLISIAGVSFSSATFWEFPPSGVSLDAYRQFFDNDGAVHSLWVSFATSMLAGFLGTAVGLMAAAVIVRAGRKVHHTLANVMLLPLIFPHIALGAALYAGLVYAGVPVYLWTIAVAQMVVVLPFAIRLLVVAMQGLNVTTERAATGLGATRIQVFRMIVLPALLPSLLMAFVLSFSTSLDDSSIALFVNSPNAITLPVRMLFWMETETAPLIAAAGTLLMAVGVLLLVVINKYIGVGRAFGMSDEGSRRR